MVDLVLFLILVSAYQDGQVVNVKEVRTEQPYACTHMQPHAHTQTHTCTNNAIHTPTLSGWSGWSGIHCDTGIYMYIDKII